MEQNSNYDKLKAEQNHYIESSLGNIYQNLMENIADFLDSESVALDEAIAGFSDPEERGESTLHERMAKAAIKEYELTMTGRLLPPDEVTRGGEAFTQSERDAYATEAIKADRERVVQAAKVYPGLEGWQKKRVYKVDPASILNLEIKLP